MPNNDQQPLSVSISDKTMIMRVGQQQLAEMPYISDSKQVPSTIDLKFQDQEMHGIYDLHGDTLKISLSDAKMERPKDFARPTTAWILCSAASKAGR